MTNENDIFNKLLFEVENKLSFLKNSVYYDCCYKQSVFRFLYNIYKENSPYKTLYQYVIYDLKKDVDIYRNYLRAYQKLEKNMLKSWEENGFKSKGHPAPSLKKNGNFIVYDYQTLQFEIDNVLHDILYKNAESKTKNTKNLTGKKYIDKLKQYDSIYKMIENECKNSFLKCLQYYHLEIGHRFETFYKFFSAMNKLDTNIAKKEKYAYFSNHLKKLLKTPNEGGGVLQNTIMTDVDLMIDEFVKCPENIENILSENRMRNKVVFRVVNELDSCLISNCDIEQLINCESAENFFYNYIGNGQHIEKNKCFEKDIDINYFRKIYG